MKTYLFVLTHGWVMAGKTESNLDVDGWIHLTNCSTVRRWGTTQGVGQLAQEGPLENTILYPQPDTLINVNQVIAVLECDELRWNK